MRRRCPAWSAGGSLPRLAPVVLAEDFSLLVRRRRMRKPSAHRTARMLH